jgi:hypothetical protein
VHNVASARVKHVDIEKQLIDLTGCGGIKFADDDRGAGQQIGEQRRPIWVHGANFASAILGTYKVSRALERCRTKPALRLGDGPARKGREPSCRSCCNTPPTPYLEQQVLTCRRLPDGSLPYD